MASDFIKELAHCEDVYEASQYYRHARLGSQAAVVEAYHEMINTIAYRMLILLAAGLDERNG